MVTTSAKTSNHSSVRSLKFIFSGIVIVLFIISFFTYKTFHRYNKEVELRIHSQRMIKALKEIEIEVLNAETGHRGYQLTRNPEYLEPYLISRDQISGKIDVLDSLSLDASQQGVRIDSLLQLIVRQYSIIDEIVNNVNENTGNSFSQYEINLLAFGKQNMKKIRDMLAIIEKEEVQLLSKTVSQQETKRELVPILLTIFNIIALAIIIYVFFYIYKLLRQKIYTEDKLRQRQVQLIEAERIVHIGNWMWDYKTNSIEWSDGLYQLYGKSPITFKPNEEKYKDYIHPEDKNDILKKIESANAAKEPYEINYRLMLDDKSIKFVHAIGIPKLNDEGELEGYIGVTQDVSVQKTNENLIIQKSQELKRSNEDLEQFAYVASHDLQEPLRKIRAFGDRLETRYSDKLGETGVDYIKRMQNAAERMQGLINDLLTFSRISRGEQQFKKQNLTTLLEDAIEDLETRIKENNAKVNYENLPEIICNASEIKRLFLNLIGNSVKFRKPDVNPVVNITCSKVKAAEIKDIFPIQGNKQYYKIVISDNGIGFDKKYQDRIFNIFQRLHGRSDYQGTGIGLAICRKIVTNHEGFIAATAKENEGAEFIIILPKKISKETS